MVAILMLLFWDPFLRASWGSALPVSSMAACQRELATAEAAYPGLTSAQLEAESEALAERAGIHAVLITDGSFCAQLGAP